MGQKDIVFKLKVELIGKLRLKFEEQIVLFGEVRAVFLKGGPVLRFLQISPGQLSHHFRLGIGSRALVIVGLLPIWTVRLRIFLLVVC